MPALRQTRKSRFVMTPSMNAAAILEQREHLSTVAQKYKSIHSTAVGATSFTGFGFQGDFEKITNPFLLLLLFLWVVLVLFSLITWNFLIKDVLF